MFALNKLAVLILLLGGTVFADSKQNEPRIIHGRPAQIGQLPYQVSVQYQDNNFAFCGGSLIDAKHVVTAAHCVNDLGKNNKIKVWAGNVTLENGGFYKTVKNIFIHEKYNPHNQDYDIAVLRLEKPFTLNNITNSIALPSSNVSDQTNCIVSGWGDTQPKLFKQTHLLYANVTIINWKSCSRVYNLTKNMICAGDNIGHDACQGDSGGPLACNLNSPQSRTSLVGIVSFGKGCGNIWYPGVYTNVYPFVNWIKEQQKRNLATSLSFNGMHYFVMLLTSVLYDFFK